LEVQKPAHERASRKIKTQGKIAEQIGEVARIAANGARKEKESRSFLQFGSELIPSFLIDDVFNYDSFPESQEDALKFQVHQVYAQINTAYASTYYISKHRSSKICYLS
jgi:hypothetical protein